VVKGVKLFVLELVEDHLELHVVKLASVDVRIHIELLRYVVHAYRQVVRHGRICINLASPHLTLYSPLVVVDSVLAQTIFPNDTLPCLVFDSLSQPFTVIVTQSSAVHGLLIGRYHLHHRCILPVGVKSIQLLLTHGM
jgi:hypothetical protein